MPGRAGQFLNEFAKRSRILKASADKKNRQPGKGPLENEGCADSGPYGTMDRDTKGRDFQEKDKEWRTQAPNGILVLKMAQQIKRPLSDLP